MLSFLIKKSAFLDSCQLHSALCSSLQAPLTSVYIQHPDTFQIWSDLNHQLNPWRLPASTHTTDPEARQQRASTLTAAAVWVWNHLPHNWVETSANARLCCDTVCVDGKFLQYRGACPVRVSGVIIISHVCVHGPQVSGCSKCSAALGCLWRWGCSWVSKTKLTWSVGAVWRAHKRFFLTSIFCPSCQLLSFLWSTLKSVQVTSRQFPFYACLWNCMLAPCKTVK